MIYFAFRLNANVGTALPTRHEPIFLHAWVSFLRPTASKIAVEAPLPSFSTAFALVLLKHDSKNPEFSSIVLSFFRKLSEQFREDRC